MGLACVPIFDACAADEVPMLGGGCLRVGVRECPGGLMGPPKWACEAVGPSFKCLPGWKTVSGGWCEPILPPQKCPAGTMAVIGHSSCLPVDDCGSGTWGKIKTSANTIYVDQNHRGTGGAGTRAQPLFTVEAALQKAAAGAHIAIAAGTYVERLIIRRKVALEGRCAQQVTIKTGIPQPAVEFKGGSTGAELRGVTITSKDNGVYIDAAAVTLERVVVKGCESHGIYLYPLATLTLRRSLVDSNRETGIFALSARVIVEQSVIRDTREKSADSTGGEGIIMQLPAGGSTPSELTLRDSLIMGNRTTGVAIHSSKATLERAVVRDTLANAISGAFGTGIQASIIQGSSLQAELFVRDSLIAQNRNSGITVGSSRATVERTVVRDTQEQASDRMGGMGVQAFIQPGLSQPAELLVRHSLISGNRKFGVFVSSSKGTIERTVVRDTRHQLSDKLAGLGIVARLEPGKTKPAEVLVRDCLIANNLEAGVAAQSAKLVLERTVIKDTRPALSTYGEGAGINAQLQQGHRLPSELTVRDSLITGSRVVGILLYSTRALVERTVVRDTLGNANTKVGGMGIQASIMIGQSIPTELTLRHSLLSGNRNVGLFLWSSKGTVERSMIRDTEVDASLKMYGNGVSASTQPGQSLPATLTIRESVVQGNQNAGISLYATSGKLSRSMVSGTRPDGNDKFGDGVVVVQKSLFDVEDALVEHSARAGFLFHGSGGSVLRSLIRHNVFAVNLEQGATPLISPDNKIVDNQTNKVTSGNGLEAAPVPTAPSPLAPDAGL